MRVHTPSVDENGWTCTHTVVEVVTDDMPFLVDSVTNELSRQGRGIHVVIHPQMIVRRDVTGKLLEVLDAGRDKLIPGPGGKSAEERELPDDAVTESWIHVEIDRETERDDLKQITDDLLRVLSDVREAVEDWRKMRGAALAHRRGAGAEPTAADLPAQEVEEARELLRWLADDHFTFLGYREYELAAEAADGDEELTLTPVARHGPGHPAVRPAAQHRRTRATPSRRPSAASRRTPAPRPASTSCWC